MTAEEEEEEEKAREREKQEILEKEEKMRTSRSMGRSERKIRIIFHERVSYDTSLDPNSLSSGLIKDMLSSLGHSKDYSKRLSKTIVGNQDRKKQEKILLLS